MKRSRSISKVFVSGLTLGVTGVALVRGAFSRPRYDLSGKTVLITGGSRGLGLIMAREFAERGARVALLARNPEDLKRATEELHARGCEVLAVECDLTDADQIERAIRRVRRHFGDIHVLVNNAGVIAVGPMDTMNDEDYRESLDVHFWAAYHAVKAVLPQMRKLGEGRIVNISSIGGKISVPHLLPYAVGKFALTGFSEGLRAELVKENIFVTSVYPGLMRTGSARRAQFKGQHRDEYSWFSVSAGLPVLSMNADRAGHRIVDACVRGAATVILTLPAKIAIPAHDMFPSVTADLMAVANFLLPKPGGIDQERRTGEESQSSVSPSWVTVLNDQAALQNNEVA